jgi:hypothetical protein
MFELTVLGDWLSTGAIAAGNLFRPSAAAGNAELDSDEVAEIVKIEVIPPVTGGGVVEELRDIKLYLDGKLHDYINVIGTDTFNQNVPITNDFSNPPVFLGTPMIDAINQGNPLVNAICPKFSDDVRVQATAGAGGISANFRIRLWGYRYELDQLTRLFGSSLGGQLSVVDRRRDRTLSLTKPTVTINKENWTQLPGGLDQAVPKIFTFFRYAFNANPTTPNVPYQFRFDTGNVDSEDENLRFEYDRFDKALLVENLGVRAAANSLNTFIWIDGERHPDSAYPTLLNNNRLHFGRGNPLLPATLPLYYPTYKLDKPYFIWNDIGYIAHTDNGVSIPANNVAISLSGRLIEIS